MKKLLAPFIFFILFLSFGISLTNAQTDGKVKEETLEGVVVAKKNDSLEVIITNGSLKGRNVIIDDSEIISQDFSQYQKADRLVIIYSKDLEGEDLFFITDYVRRNELLFLFLVFVALSALIGGWKGIRSILGMGVSFLVIFYFLLPQILQGASPILSSLLSTLVIIPVTYYLSHGWTKKTHTAVFSTIITLVVTGFLALYFVNIIKLSGFAQEEASFLQFEQSGKLDMRGLLLAGIIIGVLGILDDITISQASIVNEIRKANKKLKAKDIFTRSMRVGKDHISSLVNTLVLVYTGSSLPLLLLFIDSSRSFSEVINYEIIADEVVRTLVGSIGLILAVPITTFLAVYYPSKSKNK